MAYTMYKAIKRTKSALYFQFLVRLIISSRHLVSFVCHLVLSHRHSSTYFTSSRKTIKQGKSSPISHYPFSQRGKENIPFHTSCTSWSHRGYRHRRRDSCCALCGCRCSGICSIKHESQVVSECWGYLGSHLDEIRLSLWVVVRWRRDKKGRKIGDIYIQVDVYPALGSE